MDFINKKTKIFAYLGYPAEASSDNPVPAVVLVHGGGGHAFAEWVKIWTNRGYAAIAMDTTGYFPTDKGKNKAGREGEPSEFWAHGSDAFLEKDCTFGPDYDGMTNGDQPFENQWMYHAVTAVIRAHSILIADEKVDSSKTGLVGISWGGVISSLVIGYDYRFLFAIPVYGSAYLSTGISELQGYFKTTENQALWLAESRLSCVKFPVLWLAWASDPPFSIHGNSLSYLSTKQSGAVLSIQQEMGHSHNFGWLPNEIYLFADSVTKNTAQITKCLTEPKGRNITFEIKIPENTQSIKASVYYLTEQMTYSLKEGCVYGITTLDQTWNTYLAKVENSEKVTALLPENAKSYYVQLETMTELNTFITTTCYVEI